MSLRLRVASQSLAGVRVKVGVGRAEGGECGMLVESSKGLKWIELIGRSGRVVVLGNATGL